MDGFIKISKYAGMRPDLVQAGGGNASVKLDDNNMLVKSSGVKLAGVTKTNGYTKVNYKRLKNAIYDNIDNSIYDYNILLQNCIIDGTKPSIETYLHAVTKKYTLHVHSIVANMYLCRTDCFELLKNVIPDEKYIIIPYINPGVEIAKEIIKEFQYNEHAPDIIFMQNHGIIITADTANDIIKQYERILLKLENALNIDFSKFHNITFLQTKFPNKYIYLVNRNINVNEFVYEYCPDNIVYIGDGVKDIKMLKANENGLVKYNGYLYIISNDYKKAIDTLEVIDSIIEINKNIPKDKIKVFDKGCINALLSSEDEKYRQRI